MSFLNLKALVGGFYQDLVGAFSVIVKTDCETNGSSAALVVLLSANVGEVYLAAAGNTEYTQQ